MTGHALTINAGSSSIKFGLFDVSGEAPVERMSGLIERIGGEPHVKAKSADGAVLADRDMTAAEGANHVVALRTALAIIEERFGDAKIAVVGHRVVHGGPSYSEPVALTPEVEAELAGLAPFAPLHQPHNLSGIAAARAAFPEAVQVACFDTAFHRTHPMRSDMFGLPREYYEKGGRR